MVQLVEVKTNVFDTLIFSRVKPIHKTAWEKGYWKRPDRGLSGGFEWNNDFMIAGLDQKSQLHFIRNHPHVRRHKENEEFYLFHDNEFGSLDENKKKVLGLP